MQRIKREIHNSADLKTAIAELEGRKFVEEEAIKTDFKDFYETYKPANILKNTLSEVSASPKFRHNILNVAMGLGAGYLSQKLVIGRSAGLIKRILGTALQFGVTSLVAKVGNQDEPGTGKRSGNLFQRLIQR